MREAREVKNITAEEFNSVSNIDIDTMMDWEKVKNFIYPRMVDVREMIYLEDKPHTYAADIPVIYYIELKSGDQLVSAPIRDNLLRAWNVDIDDIDKAARQNITPQIRTLSGIIADLTNSEDDFSGVPVYVLSSTKGIYGAASLLDKESMQKIMEYLNTNTVAIIPSSIHEVLVMPYDPDMVEAQNKMIRDVNSAVVAEDDILSDHLYKYDIENGLMVA